MKVNRYRYETKTLAELEELDDESVRQLAVLGQRFAVLQQGIAALKAAKRKQKRAKK
jgi:uncharacterized small protein (DUF1192 family)